MNSGILKRGLNVIEEMLGLEHLRMTPEEPAEQLFSGSTRPNTDLPERRLEGLVIAEAASTERLLDRGVQVVVLKLRDPPGAVAPHARHPQDLTLAHAGAEEHRDDPEEAEVFLSYELVGRGTRQSERDVEAFEHRDGISISSLSSAKVWSERGGRRPPNSTYPRVRSPDATPPRPPPRRSPIASRPRTTRARSTSRRRIGPFFGLEDPVVGEPSDARGGRPPRSATPLVNPSRSCSRTVVDARGAFGCHATYELGSALKASWQVCEQK